MASHEWIGTQVKALVNLNMKKGLPGLLPFILHHYRALNLNIYFTFSKLWTKVDVKPNIHERSGGEGRRATSVTWDWINLGIWVHWAAIHGNGPP